MGNVSNNNRKLKLGTIGDLLAKGVLCVCHSHIQPLNYTGIMGHWQSNQSTPTYLQEIGSTELQSSGSIMRTHTLGQGIYIALQPTLTTPRTGQPLTRAPAHQWQWYNTGQILLTSTGTAETTETIKICDREESVCLKASSFDTFTPKIHCLKLEILVHIHPRCVLGTLNATTTMLGGR